jgi:hypothetical protein
LSIKELPKAAQDEVASEDTTTAEAPFAPLPVEQTDLFANGLGE